MSKIVINAGHTRSGKGVGAVGLLNESIETRKIAYELMKLLASTKHTIIPAVYDVSSNNLKEAVELSNSKNTDLFISIHLNASGKNSGANGVEVYTWKGKKNDYSVNICANIAKLGFKNRGVKDGSHLYVIKNTKATALLVECCFVDSEKDKKLYNDEKIAKAIFNAIK